MALLEVSGYDEFMKAVDANKENTIFAYFTGSKDAQGVSWCPDCVTAEPVVRGLLSELPEGSVFIYCQVGDRPYWKDLKNEFRTVLKVNAVPTLMKYGTSQRLVESELHKPNLVQMLLSED
ncbi:thioredoxin domain-containing protein 17 [Chiloscyllium plagiosum]|uniref:thioredoxin domain-containing protein 17 n=1 Tax=Chiloscyllium plagiosum TaxID=36176 RepID=UPI001CB83E1C|nr:thioredoxin domain-containing protein 17 [Chiloscyllium plagiosum]